MGDFSRKADGRRVFTAEFKQQVVARIQQEETTVAAVSGIPGPTVGYCVNLSGLGELTQGIFAPLRSPENPSPVVAVDYGGNTSGDNVCR